MRERGRADANSADRRASSSGVGERWRDRQRLKALQAWFGEEVWAIIASRRSGSCMICGSREGRSAGADVLYGLEERRREGVGGTGGRSCATRSIRSCPDR